MIEIISYIVLVGLLFYLAYMVFSQSLKKKKLTSEYLQMTLNYQMVKNEYEKLFEELNRIKVEKDDGFVKFLSESRSWAFEYIENTQKALAEIDLSISEILESDAKPASKVSQIKMAHKALKAILPEEQANTTTK
jgi:heme/copper-type cytochrome/quinol oxidase subunit 1